MKKAIQLFQKTGKSGELNAGRKLECDP
jgi:hypothetical protein